MGYGDIKGGQQDCKLTETEQKELDYQYKFDTFYPDCSLHLTEVVTNCLTTLVPSCMLCVSKFT